MGSAQLWGMKTKSASDRIVQTQPDRPDTGYWISVTSLFKIIIIVTSAVGHALLDLSLPIELQLARLQAPTRSVTFIAHTESHSSVVEQCERTPSQNSKQYIGCNSSDNRITL